MTFGRTLIVIALVFACSPRSQDQPAVGDPGLRDQLLARVARDQAIRDTSVVQQRATGTNTPALLRSMQAVDSANLAWLKPQIQHGGFPTTAQVGREGVLAAALLIQHADDDPSFQAAVLPQIEAAFTAGVINGEWVALLTDRVAKAQGRPQRYGTQATMTGGRLVIDPIADSAQVDARRAAMGLPPLADYKRILDSVYGPPQAP
jgi:hypothetical protein